MTIASDPIYPTDEEWAFQLARYHSDPSPLVANAMVVQAALSWHRNPHRLLRFIGDMARRPSYPSPVHEAMANLLREQMDMAVTMVDAFALMRAEIETQADKEAAHDKAIGDMYGALADAMADRDRAERTKQDGYTERARCVVALVRVWQRLGYTVGVANDDKGLRVLYADLPTGQVSWHTWSCEAIFDALNLPDYPGGWDGHSTAEKYARLDQWSQTQRFVRLDQAAIRPPLIVGDD